MPNTGNSEINSILLKLVASYELAFGSCGLSYYLIGSWTESETNSLSDIDVVVVWTNGLLTNDDIRRGDLIVASLSPPVRLDVVMYTEHELATSHLGVNLKLSSKLVHGHDIRDRLPLPPLHIYTESVTQTARPFMSRIVRGTDSLAGLIHCSRRAVRKRSPGTPAKI